MSDEWVMVPREASEAMIRAGYSAPTVFGVRDMANTYRAMLAAAPDASQRNREADRARYIDRAFNEWLDDSVADGGATVWDLVSDVHSAWAAWTAHPHYAAPAAPQQAEPVGYFVNDESDDQWHQVDYEQRNGADTYPLYLHPPAAPQQAKPVAWPAGHRWARNMAALESQSESDPTTPIIAPQQAEPVAWMAFGGALVHAVTRNAMDPIEAERFDVPLYLHPPAAPQQAEPALNERVGLAYKNGYEEALNDCIRNGGEAWARSMFANGGEHIKPQQAEPVAQIGWSDEFGNLFPMAAWKPAQRTHHDSHKTAWRPVFLHQPAAEVQKLRDAASALCGALTASELNDRAYHALNALHRALGG